MSQAHLKSQSTPSIKPSLLFTPSTSQSPVTPGRDSRKDINVDNIFESQAILQESNPKLAAAFVQAVFDLTASLSQGLPGLTAELCSIFPKLMQAEYSILYQIDNDRGEINWVDSMQQTRNNKLAITLVGFVATSGACINLRDFSSDKRFNKNVDMDRQISTKTNSLLMIPLRVKDTSVAVLSAVNCKTGQPFSEDEQRVALMLAKFISPLMERELDYESSVTEVKTTYMGRANNLLDFALEVSSELDLSRVQGTIMNEARNILNAERCTLFIVDENTKELVSSVATGVGSVRIPLGHGIAGSVAKSGDVIICNDPYNDARFDTTMDSMTGFVTQNILCIPIKWQGKVIGVSQLINKKNGEFSPNDTELFKLFSKICAVALHNCQLFAESGVARKRADALLVFLKNQVESKMFSEALNSVMEAAKEVIEADRYSLFMVDKVSQELRTRQTDGLKEIRFPMKLGIAGQAVTKQKSVICNDCYSNSNFYYAVDEQSKYRTSSLLATPILNNEGEVVAVAELINKKEGGFTPQDGELLEQFAAMAGRYLQWESIGPMLCSSQPGDNFLEQFRPQTKQREQLMQWGFNLFEKSPEDLMCLIISMFDSLHLIDKFKVPRQALVNFVWSVARSYKQEVPYHNFVHAFDVTHAMFLFITHGNLIDNYITELEAFTLLVSATCHDLNHQGYTNSFMEKTNTPFGMIYKNGAIMEQHHISILLSILSDKENNIFQGLTPSQHREVWQDMITVILATDAGHHAQQVQKFTAEFGTNRHAYDKSKKAHRRLLMSMLISWADTSNIVRPFPLAKRWAVQLSHEFFQEGDAEKKLGIEPPPIFDRNKTQLAEMQTGFIQHVGIPSYTLLKQFLPQLGVCLDQLNKNLQLWKNPGAVDLETDIEVRCHSIDEW